LKAERHSGLITAAVSAVDEVEMPQPGAAGCGILFRRIARLCHGCAGKARCENASITLDPF
jgi:hypothetical protein